MHNELNFIVAERRKRPREQHVKIPAKIVDALLVKTDALVAELNAAKAEAHELRRKLEAK